MRTDPNTSSRTSNQQYGRAVGIDLGTTYSCVAVWQNDRVEVIPNDQGSRTTPSCVAFNESERLIGDPAKCQSAMNPANTVFDAKRLMGRKFTDQEVQSSMNHWPFKVIESSCGKPLVQVEFKGQQKQFTPEEISSMVLMKMKETAEAYLGETVTTAVITVPAFFNNHQRQATLDAAAISGLNVRRLMNEPTAAAVAYGLDNKTEGEKIALIFDLGGGTFDVSILTLEDGVIDVKATVGNTDFGGNDFDDRLVGHFIEEIRRKHKKDISIYPRALRRLRTACELAKRTLSSSTHTTIELESLFDGIDFYSSITRDQFEELCLDLFTATLTTIERVLRQAELDKSNVDEIVMVGGSTRIPKIQTMVSDYFDGKTPCKSINPDEAVVCGAAVQAAALTRNGSDKINDILCIDVLPHSLGIMTDNTRDFNPIIKGGNHIPAKRFDVVSTDHDNQSGVQVQIYEREVFQTNLDFSGVPLCKLNFHGISPAPRGVPQIQVVLDVDENGIVTVSAKDKLINYKNQNFTITNDPTRLSQAEINCMIYEAEQFKKYEKAAVDRVAARSSLEGYAYSLRNTLEDTHVSGKWNTADKSRVHDAIESTIQWLECNAEAGTVEFEHQQRELEAVVKPIMSKIYTNATSRATAAFDGFQHFNKPLYL